MHLTTENKILIGIVVVTFVLLGAGAYFLSTTGPGPSKAEFPVEETLSSGMYSKGNKNANVKIAEYSDFQCPACAAAAPIVTEVLNEYGDKVYFEYHYFPLKIHRWGELSSEAAAAAGEQGKFFEYGDLLFKKQAEWGENNNPKDLFKKYAKEVGIDENKLADAIDKHTFADIVRTSVKKGDQLGVNATPTFFLNGKRIEGGITKTEWKQRIDQALK